MTESGKIYIKNLINEINIKCKKSKIYNDRYRGAFANYRSVAGFNTFLKQLMFTLVIKKAEGAYIEDIDDNRYLDISMGFGVNLFGHAPNFINEAIKSQILKGYSLGPLYEEAAQVANLINELTEVNRSAFFNSGTEAIMVATRLAKAATGKDKVIIFAGSYHGTFDSLLSIRANSITKQAMPHVPGITKNIISDTIILRYGADESLEYIKNHKDSIAAVLTEPVQSRNPGYQPKKFISELRNICTENDIILVFDEIITGFRYSNSGTMGFYKVIPDLVTFGKTIGGGMPIGVVSGRSEVMDYIDGGSWKFSDDSYPKSKTTFVAGTFCHHPLTMAVSKCVLEELKNRKSIQIELNEKTDNLSIKLNRFFRQNSFPIITENFGSLFYFKVKGNARFLFYGMLREGIYVWEGRTCFLSTAHSKTDINFLIEKIMKICFELRQTKII